MFIFFKNSAQVLKLNISSRSLRANDFTVLPDTIHIQHVLQYQKGFLIFSSLKENGEDKTCVYKLNLLSKKVTPHDHINGPTQDIVTFSNDESTFVLLNNGSLFQILNAAGKVSFNFIGKLWTIQRNLNGALTYKDKLVIYGSNPLNEPSHQILHDSLPGYFKIIKYFGNDIACSNFIPVTLFKQDMLAIKK